MIKRTAAARFVFWTVLLVAVAVAVAWFVVFPSLERQHLLDSQGIGSRAKIIRQQVTHDSDSGDTFLLTYEYEVQGRFYRFEVNVPVAYSRLAVVSILPIHYAASRPEISRLDGVNDNGSWWLVEVVGVSWAVLALSVFCLVSQKKLLVSGMVVCGVVTKVEDEETSTRTVHYEFFDSAGVIATDVRLSQIRRRP
jgi:hypothetical protein